MQTKQKIIFYFYISFLCILQCISEDPSCKERPSCLERLKNITIKNECEFELKIFGKYGFLEGQGEKTIGIRSDNELTLNQSMTVHTIRVNASNDGNWLEFNTDGSFMQYKINNTGAWKAIEGGRHLANWSIPRVEPSKIEWFDNWAKACNFSDPTVTSYQIPGEKCGNQCYATDGCTHFTWTTFNGGTCSLKSKPGVSKKDAIYTGQLQNICGLRSAISPIVWNKKWAYECDFKGANMSSAQVPGEACGPTCDNTIGCTHFTWSTYNRGTCWLKNKIGITKQDAIFNNNEETLCGLI